VLGVSGDECTSLVAELNDAVFVGNYYSIKKNGTDMFGNSRELTWFDHIALPFAIIGTLAPELPFGRFVSDGLKGGWRGGGHFSRAAFDWMKSVAISAPEGKIATDGPWTFMQSIVRISGEHIDEVMERIRVGDFGEAAERLEEYLASDLGNIPYEVGTDFSDAMKTRLPDARWKSLMDTIHGFAPQADSIIKTASKPSLSPSEVANIADAAGRSDIMDAATSAVYESLMDIGTAHSAEVAELANIIRNSPEIAARVGAENAPMQHLVDLTAEQYDLVNTQIGSAKANQWFKNNSKITKSALDSADPEGMADIPYASQTHAASYEDVAADMGGNIADDIVKAADDIVAQPTSNWKTTAKQTVKNTSNKFWNYYSGLSDAKKETLIHAMMGSALVFSLVVLYKIYTDSGEQSLNQNLFAKTMDTWYWPCFSACEGRNADELADAIKIYEQVINECAESLEEYRDAVTADGLYDEFYRTLELHRFNLSKLKRCLKGLTPCGNIRCTSNTAFFYVDLDGDPAGFSFANREVLLEAIRVGSHTVKIHKHGWTPACTESITVTEGATKEFDCEMTEVGGCSPITNLKIYVDPLSPTTDDTVSFNGSANSGDTITSWEWDFDDGYTTEGQAVTHRYRSDDVYTVKLKVTNSCGVSEFTTRNVTVTDEPISESTSFTIERPIGEDGKDIDRYWEIEIWVDGKFTECLGPRTFTFGTGVYCDCKPPYDNVECELGSHEITLKKPGYEDKIATVYLRKDEPKTWYSPVMVKSGSTPGHVVSFTVPVGSIAYVDGKRLT